jgi:hypothetical protein
MTGIPITWAVSTLGGTEFLLSAWVKQGPQQKFMSLSVRPKNNTNEKAAPAPDPLDDVAAF